MAGFSKVVNPDMRNEDAPQALLTGKSEVESTVYKNHLSIYSKLKDAG